MPNDVFPNAPEEEGQSGDPWELLAPEPTNFIAPWPGDQFPTREEVLAALNAQHENVEVVEDIDPQDPSIPWAMAVTAANISIPVILWCEPARPLPPGELNDPRAEACQWILGLESVLDQTDPLASYENLVRFLFLPFPDLPGLLDANTTGWMNHTSLEDFFLEAGSQAPAEALWIIHVVSEENNDSGKAWLHTHGLWRCGRPELEMLNVEKAFLHEASSLLNDLAERMIDESPPPPGQPYLIGDELEIMLYPWQEVVNRIPADSPGGAQYRQESPDNVHLGARAVICDVQPDSDTGLIRTWPRDVLQRIVTDEMLLYKSGPATERLARRARHTWGELATAYVKLRPFLAAEMNDPQAMVLLKVAFAYEGELKENQHAEHMWFEALRFEGDRAEGRLLNTPVQITEIKKDQVLWIQRDRLSDWEIQTEIGAFGPNTVTTMWRAIDAIAREGQLK